MKTLKGILKMLCFALWSFIIVPIQLLVMLFHKGRYAYLIPHLWHKGVCYIFGIRVVVSGQPIQKEQVIHVSNHLSYLDIPVIGSFLKASFVAKKDVAKWPVFGFLSKLQQTAFIDRNTAAAAKETNSLSSMLKKGKSLIIFPEGTSTDGRDVLPFKSSIFSIMLRDQEQSLKIQPLTIEMKLINKKAPENQETKDLYAWHRDMDTELPTHLWRFAKSSGATISLCFHPSLQSSNFSDRKTLAKQCHEQVCMGLEKAA